MHKCSGRMVNFFMWVIARPIDCPSSGSSIEWPGGNLIRMLDGRVSLLTGVWLTLYFVYGLLECRWYYCPTRLRHGDACQISTATHWTFVSNCKRRRRSFRIEIVSAYYGINWYGDVIHALAIWFTLTFGDTESDVDWCLHSVRKHIQSKRTCCCVYRLASTPTSSIAVSIYIWEAFWSQLIYLLTHNVQMDWPIHLSCTYI